MCHNRNRAEGWQHAKMSGHFNEEKVAELIRKEKNVFFDKINFFCEPIEKNIFSNKISKIEYGGLKEKNVKSVLGDTTKSKTDLKIYFSNGQIANFSLKKSKGGQVYLIKTSRFIAGYEKHYEKIPDNIKNMLFIFFGEIDSIQDIIDKIHNDYPDIDPKIKKYENRKKRLVFENLKKIEPANSILLLEWIKNNIQKISEFCFSKGLSSEEMEWADFVIYYNLINNEDDIFYCFSIKKIKEICEKNKVEEIYPGTRGGGTTIQLPFGFLQWHQSSMQFHHQIDKILKFMRTDD